MISSSSETDTGSPVWLPRYLQASSPPLQTRPLPWSGHPGREGTVGRVQRRDSVLSPKCRKTFCSFLSRSSWSWASRSEYCCCLIFWMIASASWNGDMPGQTLFLTTLRTHHTKAGAPAVSVAVRIRNAWRGCNITITSPRLAQICTWHLLLLHTGL